MIRRFFALAVSLMLLAGFVGYHFQAGAQEPKKDEPAKKETKKDEKKDDKKEEPKKEPFVPDVPVKELKGHGDWINALVISGDGKYIATAGRDRTVKIWDIQTGQEVATLKGSPENIKGLVFLDGSAKVVSSTGKWNKDKKSWEGEIKVWDIKAGKEVRAIKGHADTIEGLALSKDGKYLASASADQTVIIWELATGKEIQTLKGHTDTVEAVAFSSDGKKLATAGADKTVRIWDASTGQNLVTFKAEPPVKAPDPKKDLAGKDAQDAAKKDEPKKEDVKKEEKKDETKKKKNAGKKDMTKKKDEPKELGRPFTCVAFSPDDTKLCAGSLEGIVKIFDTATLKEVGELKANEGIWALAYNADGSKLATGGWDQTIKIWDAHTDKELFNIKAHNGTVTALAFSPDGQFVVSASIDGTIRIWNAAGAPAKK